MEKVQKLCLCGQFRDLRVTLNVKLQASNFSTDKDYILQIYLVQFETHENHHKLQGKICEKYRKKIPKRGLYLPQAQFYPQHKVLKCGTCKKNIIMCSQVKF